MSYSQRGNSNNVIIKVEKGSIAAEIGIEVGDVLISINDEPVHDVFDYRYLINEEYIEMCIKSSDSMYIAEIEKELDEDIGIMFESGLMDEAKSCRNKCIFCFIDQLPKGMRDTLYFKDDDSRLSFLQGNYVTLTNMKDSDIDRIIYYHLSPINISVHTTDLDLRKKMLKNKNADNVINIMQRLTKAKIEMNLQIVLCNGINDGDILDKSISDLSEFYPSAKSLSVVPIGLTKYRQGLYDMKPFSKEESGRVIDQIEGWQKKLKIKNGDNFVFCADEFYITAGREMPNEECYENFPQIENGVGMISSMKYEFDRYFSNIKGNTSIEKKVSIATGTAAFEFINSLCNEIMVKYPGINIRVYAILNNFFGRKITVSGLLTGCDIIEQLKGKDLGDYLMLPKNLLKRDEEILLDNVLVEDIEKALGINIKITGDNAKEFVDNIIS